MDDYLKTVGESVKRQRAIKGLSRRALGELVGLSGQSIWNIETGRTDPKLVTLRKLAEALHVHIATLVTGVSEEGLLKAALEVLEEVRRLANRINLANVEIIRRERMLDD